MDSVNQSLESAKKSIGSSLSKLPNAGIEKENDVFKKPPVLIEISWQTYRLVGFIFFGLSFAIMKYIVDHFEQKIDDGEIMNVLKIVSFFFILNFGTFLFMTVYYKFRKSVKGVKGPKGDVGIRGPQGKSSHCNICKVKTGSFKKDRKTPMKKEQIEQKTILDFSSRPTNVWKAFADSTTPPNALYHISVGSPAKTFIIMNPDTIGVSKAQVGTQIVTQENDEWLPDKKPIIGVSASINKNNGDLYSIMFFYDGNKTHSIQNYKYKPFDGVKLGSDTKKGDAFEFRAPKNSAVYKVKTYDNGVIIKAIRFYCADIKTGKQVKVMDPFTNKMRSYGHIGVSIDENNQNINIQTVACSKIIVGEKVVQPFLSRVGGWQTSEHVCAIKFSGASYFDY